MRRQERMCVLGKWESKWAKRIHCDYWVAFRTRLRNLIMNLRTRTVIVSFILVIFKPNMGRPGVTRYNRARETREL